MEKEARRGGGRRQSFLSAVQISEGNRLWNRERENSRGLIIFPLFCMRSAGVWPGGWGLCWRTQPGHVCSCVGFLTPGLVADGTVSKRSAQQEAGLKPPATWAQVTQTSRGRNVFAQPHTKPNRFQKQGKKIKNSHGGIFSMIVSRCVRKRTLAGVAAAGALANRERRTTGACTWPRAWTHEVLSE